MLIACCHFSAPSVFQHGRSFLFCGVCISRDRDGHCFRFAHYEHSDGHCQHRQDHCTKSDFSFYGVPPSVWAGEVYYGTKALFVSSNPIGTTNLLDYYAWLGIHTSINCIPVGVRATYPRVTRIFLSPPLFSIMATYSLYASTRVKGSYKLSVNNCSA